jgi:thioredoxin reductase
VNVDVLVVGAGPAGLTAAAELRRAGVERVLVADREAEAGGVPRHCMHTGYGVGELHRMLTGPVYARALADAAVLAGAQVRTRCTVTELSRPAAGGTGAVATLTSAAGIDSVSAAAVLLATGCRERPRAARLVPGDRPGAPGVLTTGELQQRVYLAGERLSGRALVVGAEHVSFSAMLTLEHAGAHVVALVTEHERHQTYGAFRLAAALRWRTPVWTLSKVSRIAGRTGRVNGVELADVRSGARRFVPCELVVFTADWIPDRELARTARLAIDPGTAGPVVDTALATSAPGVFAAGNVVHAGETAAAAARSGRHAARQVAAFLAGRRAEGTRIPIQVDRPLQWIAPNAVTAGAALVTPPRARFTLRSAEVRRVARLEVHQNGKVLTRSSPQSLVPGRPAYLNAAWLARVDPAGGPVLVRVS